MNWLRKNWWWLIIIGIWTQVTVRVEPFKSNFLLAIVGAVLVGLAGGAIEVAIRKIASRQH
jgi:hypothetical protein